MRPPGNSVLRVHRTTDRGRGLVTPIYRAALERPGVTFHWNEKAVRLIRDGDRIVGAETEGTRTGERTERRAGSVLLATGGFQSNLDLVRQYWRDDIPFPERFLVGAGLNAYGSGLALARDAGGTLARMDHQWNYATGMHDPRFPNQWRGVNGHNFAAIWVNLEGQRFVNESYSAKHALPALVQQTDNTYWLVFDSVGREMFGIHGTGWGDPAVIEELVFDNPDVIRQGESIAALASATGLPAAALAATIRRYNQLVAGGSDTDFGRFGPGIDRRDMEEYEPAPLARAPFYALQFYPMTRKSMGGIAIDQACRVVTESGAAIDGLYAAGEVTGFEASTVEPGWKAPSSALDADGSDLSPYDCRRPRDHPARRRRDARFDPWLRPLQWIATFV